ncbi:MAG: hypothetical protein K8T89_18620 [Planctomycetes bacterium]|nr:hypothetical protein [Planctomycetota bacterium]
MLKTTEAPILETVRQSSPDAKAAILAEIMRERIVEQQDGELISILDKTGERLGTFVPSSRFQSTRKTPPELTPGERAELQHRYENRDKSFSVETMLKSLDLDDPAPSSKL